MENTTNDPKQEQKQDPPERPSHILEAPEAVLSTMNKDGTRKWMYPKLSKGSMYTRRKIVGWILIALFFALPIVKMNGEPAMFLDIVHRRFAIFGQIFYATDTLLLMLLGLTLVISVVWATALFGRVWCGWGCPQTVYMEFIFRPIERLVEGTEAQRKRRDKQGWTPDKVWRTAVKLFLYTIIAAAMSHTFVAYFVSWDVLTSWMTGAPSKHWGFFLMMGITTALIVFDFAYFREQMCTIACPYARLQSVLMDPDSLIVSYDPSRGETRGRRTKAQREQEKQGIKLKNLGDCIDCGACVRTCPTGIDIRDGLQLECISCTQCIDACDAIMIGVGKEPGLVRYTSENKIDNKPSRILRPRLVLYTGLLVLFSSVLLYLVTHASMFDINMMRATDKPFTVLPDGQVSNHFKMRTQNRIGSSQDLQVTVIEPEGAVIKAQNDAKFTLKPGQMKYIDLWIVSPNEVFKSGQSTAKLRVSNGSGAEQIIEHKMLGPVSAK